MNTKNQNKDIIAKLEEFISKSLTGAKGRVIDSTVSITDGDIYAIHALTNTTFTTINGDFKGSSIIAAATMSAGDTIYLPIKNLELASGVAVIYQHKLS